MLTARMKAHFDISFEELEDRYIRRGISINDIASEYSVGNKIIRNRLIAYGIAIRSMSIVYTNMERCKEKNSFAHRGERNYLYGKKRGVAFCERLRQANLGKRHSEETKRKLSLINMGNISAKKGYARGWKHTPEMLEKMRQVALGRQISEETRLKSSLAHRGHKRHTAYQLKRCREANLGNTHVKGRKQSIEERMKRSVSAKLAYEQNKDYREKISISKLGQLNPSWRGGVTDEPYPTGFNRHLKELVRERDGYICQLCHISQNGRRHCVHHIDYDKGNCNLSNLITLCTHCNMKVNTSRDYWQGYFTYVPQ